MDTSGSLDRGRKAFEASAWASAYAELTAADVEAPLGPDDLERLAASAYLIGEEDVSADLWVRAYHEWMESGADAHAARCAFWLAIGFLLSGAAARYGGWLTRMRRLLDDGDPERAELGYVVVLTALEDMFRGDAEAYVGFEDAIRRGERSGDSDVVALARLGRGQALIGRAGPWRGWLPSMR